MDIREYIRQINEQFRTGNAREHSYRPMLQQLLGDMLSGLVVTNEPARTVCGAPDFIITRKGMPVFFIEAKDINDSDLDGRGQHREQFDRKAAIGQRLIGLHLLKDAQTWNLDTTFPEAGDQRVERYSFAGGKVWINDTQYFGNVPETAWNFYIGGYQPAQKWLKDRKGRTLTFDDIKHYLHIIHALAETDRLMKKIG